MMPERKPPIYLITGLILGLIIGVVYAWMFSPEEALETNPAMLREDFKNEYRELIARAYLYSSDLGRAQARLNLLGDEDPARELAVQAQLSLTDPSETRASRALGLLSAAVNAENEGIEITAAEDTPLPKEPEDSPSEQPADQPSDAAPTATREAAAPTATPGPQDTPEGDGEDPEEEEPTPSPTMTATATQTATPGPPFVLNGYQLLCDPAIDPPKIQVYVFNAASDPVPGVAVLVFWEGNVDRFVTGLKPSFGLGYADFEMDPSKTYTLRLENGGDPIQSITGEMCEGDGDSFYGSWVFNFIQP